MEKLAWIRLRKLPCLSAFLWDEHVITNALRLPSFSWVSHRDNLKQWLIDSTKIPNKFPDNHSGPFQAMQRKWPNPHLTKLPWLGLSMHWNDAWEQRINYNKSQIVSPVTGWGYPSRLIAFVQWFPGFWRYHRSAVLPDTPHRLRTHWKQLLSVAEHENVCQVPSLLHSEAKDGRIPSWCFCCAPFIYFYHWSTKHREVRSCQINLPKKAKSPRVPIL